MKEISKKIDVLFVWDSSHFVFWLWSEALHWVLADCPTLLHQMNASPSLIPSHLALLHFSRLKAKNIPRSREHSFYNIILGFKTGYLYT